MVALLRGAREEGDGNNVEFEDYEYGDDSSFFFLKKQTNLIYI